MDRPISNFKQIMDLVELYPNDQELGKNVRQVYYKQLLQDFKNDKAYIKEHSSRIDTASFDSLPKIGV